MTATPQKISLPSPLPGHPRLLATPDDWTRLRKLVREDAAATRILSTLRRKADALLAVPTVEREMIGRRLLHTSRTALERISLLAMVAKVDGTPHHARRAVEEMLQVARFADWNPAHHLDTAEMALAVAIGYDWLQDHLSPAEKDLLADALRVKGLEPSLTDPPPWFVRADNNWSQVCHAGVCAAAIALADRDPETCRAILQRAVDNLPIAAAAYAPDGVYPEGPMYWNYGTLFHTVLAAALQRFLGSTCGVDGYEGFAESAEYISQVTTPGGEFFPYADCRPTRHLLIPLFWLARQFHRPDWVATELAQLGDCLRLYESGDYDDSNYRLLALALLWHDPQAAQPASLEKPLHWLGRGPMPVAVHRSAFNDPLATYAALKGGSPSLNHAHMDVGAFMLQAEGVVWAKDLGMQEYQSLEGLGINLWDSQENGVRWTIFRLGPEGHNILRFDGRPQNVQGSARFVRFQDQGPNPHSVLELDSLYTGQAANVRRGLMLVENRAVLIQDEWTAGDRAVAVTWQMITQAGVTLGPDAITLHQDGKTLRLLLPDGVRPDVQITETARLEHPFDTPNPGHRRLSLTVRTEVGQSGRLRILAVPAGAGEISAPAFQPLLSWSQPLEERRA